MRATHSELRDGAEASSVWRRLQSVKVQNQTTLDASGLRFSLDSSGAIYGND